MVSSVPARAPRGRQVNALQALALLMAFVLVAVLGGVLAAGLVMPAVATTSSVTDASVQLFDDLPDELEPQPLSQQSRVWAADDTLLATFYWENRIVVPLDQISKEMQNAVIATEDKRFLDHGGVDVTGMGRALVRNFMKKGETEGASTLTQQYVKNVLIEAAHSKGDTAAVAAATESQGSAGIARKLAEAKMAISLEKRMTKDEILQGYLNIAQFGPSVYGVETAAQHYFSVSAKDLDYLQAATIAGITQAPNELDPVSNPEGAQNRRDTVLFLLHQQDYIDDEQYQKGLDTPLADTLKVSEREQGCAAAGGAAYFCEYVTDVIMNSEEFGKNRKERQALLYRGGLDIYTTISLKRQKLADAAVRASVPTQDSSKLGHALVSIEPGTGEIVAMAQNRKFNPRKNPKWYETAVNYNTTSQYGGSKGFQVGSTFKPFVLAEWLRQGKSLADVVSAERTAYQGDDWIASCMGEGYSFYGGDYRPVNYDGGGSGSMSVLKATANSVNTAYVSMQNQLDVCKTAETAQKIGFERADGADFRVFPSQVLGVNEGAPLTMAASYATFAAKGVYCEPIAITKVTNAAGEDLPVPDANCREVLDPKIAATVTYALTKVMTEGSGTAAALPGRPSAGKTGTSNENWHTWFVGYTPQLSTAVWLGNPDRNQSQQDITINGDYKPIVYGGTISAPTWRQYMIGATEGMKVLSFPDPNQKMVFGERIAVPNVYARSFEDAQAILEDAGFRVQRGGSIWSNAPKGTVGGTNPGSGAMVSRGATITLLESKGPEPKKPEKPGNDDEDDRGGNNDGGGNRGPGRDD